MKDRNSLHLVNSVTRFFFERRRPFSWKAFSRAAAFAFLLSGISCTAASERSSGCSLSSIRVGTRIQAQTAGSEQLLYHQIRKEWDANSKIRLEPSLPERISTTTSASTDKQRVSSVNFLLLVQEKQIESDHLISLRLMDLETGSIVAQEMAFRKEADALRNRIQNIIASLESERCSEP